MESFKEDMTMKLFGRSYNLAKAANQCVQCGKTANKFTDSLSEREYQLTALCQKCQDLVFAEPLDGWKKL